MASGVELAGLAYLRTAPSFVSFDSIFPKYGKPTGRIAAGWVTMSTGLATASSDWPVGAAIHSYTRHGRVLESFLSAINKCQVGVYR